MIAFEAAMARRLDAGSRVPLAVALSGGGDSMALLHLTLGWIGRRRPVLALTVDHGLNPESARWTTEAGERAQAMGAAWRPLRWEGDKPSTGIQARARAARHAVLAEATREAGARVLLMGHTADDVAEGEVMRAGDAPGLGRLRAWAPSPAWPEGRGVMLLRPLLQVRRRALRDYLVRHGLAWLEDPANTDQHFARVRARNRLSAQPGEGRDTSGATWVPASAEIRGEGGERPVSFSAAGAVAATELLAAPGANPVLSALLLSVSGGSRPPRTAELERLIETIRGGGVATLCRCRVDARSGRLEVSRAPPRRGQPARPLEPAAWVEARFRAACGLYPDEASLPALDG